MNELSRFAVLLTLTLAPAFAAAGEMPPPPADAAPKSDAATVAVPGTPVAATPAAETKPAAVSAAPDARPAARGLALTVEEAVVASLEHNPSFRSTRLSPAIARTYESTARAAFDPTLAAGVSRARASTESENENARSVTTAADSDGVTRAADVSLSETLPTGTTVSLSGGRTLADTETRNGGRVPDTLSATNDATLSVTQSLLKGFGPRVNLVSLRQARIDTDISFFELRGAAEELVAEVEEACWDYVLALRKIAIYQDSLKIAEDQRAETLERIRIGKLAETEAAAAEAEVAANREKLIDARSALAKARLTLIRLLDAGADGDAWDRDVEIRSEPSAPARGADNVEDHVRLALKQRPDLAQSRLSLSRGELDVVKTRNGLLPQLDFFVTLGRSRYAKSFSTGIDNDGNDRDVTVGVNLEYALGSRAERAAHRRSLLSLEQAKLALVNMERLAQVDVREAHIEAARTLEQITATEATRKLRDETLRAETEKFRVGKSTALLVAQAQRDQVSARIDEIEAVIGHLKALVNLYLQDGSLLERRGVRMEKYDGR